MADHLRLGNVPRRRATPQPAPGAPVQRHRQCEVRAGVVEPDPRLLGQPARRVLRRGLLREVAGIGQDPQPQLRQLRLGPHQLCNAAALSSVDMNVGFTPATPFSEARMSEAHATIG